MSAPLVLVEPGHAGGESVVGRDHDNHVSAALAAGFERRELPAFWSWNPTADELREVLVPEPAPRPAIWLGTIPDPHVYRLLAETTAALGMPLVNSVDEHLEVMEFDRFYPRLAGLTPRSQIIDDSDEPDEAAVESLGWPVFVKGALQSLKSKGAAACVASDMSELHELVATLRGHKLGRGRVIVREWVELRHERRRPGGLPEGREFRAFVWRGEVLGLGYYWADAPADETTRLTASERAEVTALASEAARRLSTPLVAVDIGQLVDGRWTVIEVGDPQFAGGGLIDLDDYYRRLCAALR